VFTLVLRAVSCISGCTCISCASGCLLHVCFRLHVFTLVLQAARVYTCTSGCTCVLVLQAARVFLNFRLHVFALALQAARVSCASGCTCVSCTSDCMCLHLYFRQFLILQAASVFLYFRLHSCASGCLLHVCFRLRVYSCTSGCVLYFRLHMFVLVLQLLSYTSGCTCIPVLQAVCCTCASVLCVAVCACVCVAFWL
jgi:hypothetical protein